MIDREQNYLSGLGPDSVGAARSILDGGAGADIIWYVFTRAGDAGIILPEISTFSDEKLANRKKVGLSVMVLTPV